MDRLVAGKGDEPCDREGERVNHNNPPQELVRETQEEEIHAVRLKDLPVRDAQAAE